MFVESFIYHKGYFPEHSYERFLPDGNVQIIFDLTDYPKYIYDNESLKEIQACTNVWFSGFRTEPITIPAGENSEMLVVNFQMGKAFPFICEPMQNLTNHVVDAELVLSQEILDIRNRLQDVDTIAQKFSLLEEALIGKFQSAMVENPFVEYVISSLTSVPNQQSLKSIAEKVGYSQKHLIDIFKRHVGVAPKDFLKVIRFQKTITEIEARHQINWSAIALDCGFYDQSHFNADFKIFSGYTPRQYLSQKGEYLNYVPVD